MTSVASFKIQRVITTRFSLQIRNCALLNIFRLVHDPGEVKGRILQDVITDYGKQIQVGSILVLRRPSVLHMTPNCFVTITKKCLIGIFSSQSNEVNYITLNEKRKRVSRSFSFLKITQLRRFAKEDLITWLSEPVIYGDPVMTGEETSEPIEPPVTLFTSASSALAATSMARFGTPASVHRSNERFITPTNFNSPRPPINVTPRPTMNTTPRPLVSSTPRPFVRPPQISTAQPTRPPINNGSQFSYKSPSAIVSTPRPAPYHQPNRSSPVLSATASISTGPGNKPENAGENFLSQFLQGVDTDSLFDDF